MQYFFDFFLFEIGSWFVLLIACLWLPREECTNFNGYFFRQAVAWVGLLLFPAPGPLTQHGSDATCVHGDQTILERTLRTGVGNELLRPKQRRTKGGVWAENNYKELQNYQNAKNLDPFSPVSSCPQSLIRNFQYAMCRGYHNAFNLLSWL